MSNTKIEDEIQALGIRRGMELVCVCSKDHIIQPGVIATVASIAISPVISVVITDDEFTLFTVETVSGRDMTGSILSGKIRKLPIVTFRRLSDYSDVEIFKIKLSGRLPE